MTSILWVSLFLSVLAPLIFWFEGLSLGINFFVYIVLFVLGLIYLLRKFDRIKDEKAKYLVIPIFILAATFFVYYNRFFNRWNMIVIPFLIMFMIQWMISGKFSFNLNSILTSIEMLFIPLDQINETRTAIKNTLKKNKEIEDENQKVGKKSHKKLFISVMITIFVVFVVGVILASADDDFARIFGKVIDAIFDFIKSIRLWRLFLRAIVAFLIYLYLSSFFYTYCCVFEVAENEKAEKPKKDLYTFKMVMAGLNVLYLVFVIVQFKAIFFPSGPVQYSKYAREGFFQLIGISLLNLIMIIFSIKNKRNEDDKEVSYVRIMNILMIVFTFIILLSSSLKMYYCVDEFGYTVHRLIVISALIEELILIIPTAMFITNEEIKLSKCYFISIFAVYLVMNVFNFEYIVAAKNVDRYYSTGKIDLEYIAEYTGTDAVKPLLRVVEEKNSKDINYSKTRSELVKYLKHVNEKTVGDMDFREFNVSKAVASSLTTGIRDTEEETKTKTKTKSRSIYNDDEDL